MHLPLSANESLHLTGALVCMDFAFCDAESVWGCKSVLDIIFLSTRYPFSFLRRIKRPPLVVLQYSFNILKARKRTFMRIRADEDGALDKSYEFNMLLLANNIQLETIGRHG